MRPGILTTLLLLCGLARPSNAQWYIGLEIAATRYGGSTRDTSNSHVAHGRPGDAMQLGIRVGRSGRRIGVGLRVAYANPGFTATGEGLSLTDKTTGRLYEISSVVSTRVGGVGPSGAVRAELGPALHLWDFDGDVRARVGALGAAVYEWPVAGRFVGALRLEGTASKSWFNTGDVPPEFERRVTWRYGVGVGVRYRL